jgi:hypothetical protein
VKESPSRASNPLQGEGEFSLLGKLPTRTHALKRGLLGRSFKFGAASALEQMEKITIDKLPKTL